MEHQGNWRGKQWLSPTGMDFLTTLDLNGKYSLSLSISFPQLLVFSYTWLPHGLSADELPALRGAKPVRISDSLNLWLFFDTGQGSFKPACPIGRWWFSTLMLFIKGLTTLPYLSLTLYYPQKFWKVVSKVEILLEAHSTLAGNRALTRSEVKGIFGMNLRNEFPYITTWDLTYKQHGWNWRPTNIKRPMWWWLIPPLKILKGHLNYNRKLNPH